MKLAELEALLGFKLAVIVAGFIGGVIQLALNPKLSVFGALLSVFAGAACAGYVTPMVHHIYALPLPVENSVAFFLGLLGMQLTAKVYAFFGTLSLADIWRRKSLEDYPPRNTPKE